MTRAVPGILALCLALILTVAGVARAEEFLTVAEDLPIMAGMTELPGAVVFDKPGGRIVEAYASGPVATAEVRRFYQTTLPQLGWEHKSDLAFERDNERLQISLSGGDGALTVRYDIAPR